MRVAAVAPSRVEKWFSHLKIVVAERAQERRSDRAGSRLRWVTKSIRSGCGSASTAPGTAAGSPARDYAKLLHDDLKLRDHLRKKLSRRRRVARGDRASGEEAARDHLCGAAGRGDRQEGPGHRDSAQGPGKMAKAEVSLNIVEIRKPEIDAHAGGREHRPAAGAPRRVPPGDEARGAVGHAARRAGHPHQLRRPSGRRGNRAGGVVSRRPRAAAHAARRHRLRHRRPRRRPTAPAA